MKKLFLAAAGLTAIAALGGVFQLNVSHAQQRGGGSEPFTIPLGQPDVGSNQPFLPATPDSQKLPPLPKSAAEMPPGPSKTLATPSPNTAEILAGQSRPSAGGFPQGGPDSEKPSALREFLNQNFDAPDPNQDIALGPQSGNWVIYVHCYSGKDAAKMARDMVLELRTNPQYKLNAFVLRKGVQECKAEQKRIIEEIQRQRDLLVERGLPADTPVRVPVVRYEIQYAVLVGGYRDMESARRDLERVKSHPPDPKKVMLDMEYVVKCDKNGNPTEGDYVPVNPFARAGVFANPTLAANTANSNTAEELAMYRRLNADESFSLLKCPKKYTLAIKQFSLGVEIQQQQQKGPSSMFSIPDFFKATKQDPAAISAHNLAKVLHDVKNLETYVLHTRHCSFVTVGSYDSPDDPRLKRDQELLPQAYQHLQQAVQFAPHPVVMEVPK